jgi:hypothetical protein
LQVIELVAVASPGVFLFYRNNQAAESPFLRFSTAAAAVAWHRCLLCQVVTGWLVVSRVRLQRSTQLRNLQALPGSFLGMFFISHLTGVFSGRFVQHVDTSFSWATGGPHGLPTNPGSPSMVPYYSLAVLAFFIHAATVGRWTLAPALGQSAALNICYAVIALGMVVTLALLLPMAGIQLS